MKTLNRAMTEIVRLTRAGRPGDATELIRSALAGTPPQSRGGEVVDLIPHARTSPRSTLPRNKSVPPPTRGGTFTEHAFSGRQGTLHYKLYRPAGTTGAMPLVVMLHGCTQNPDDFARGTGMNRLADELGLLVAYPAQSQGANANRCWNWFRPGDQRRDAGEPAMIGGITREIIAGHPVDPARVYVAGMSAGGAAAAIMGAAYPDLYAAIGVHSGLAVGSARSLMSALTAMKQGGGGAGQGAPGQGFVPVISFHSDSDTTVAEINGREIVERAAAAAIVPLTTRTTHGRSAGGRGYTRTISEDSAGRILIEQWTIAGGGHAWAGGDRSGSYTDPSGPDASREMLRFFLAQTLAAKTEG